MAANTTRAAGAWETGANWSLGRKPDATDDPITIAHAMTITTDEKTDAGKLANVQFSAAVVLTINGRDYAPGSTPPATLWCNRFLSPPGWTGEVRFRGNTTEQDSAVLKTDELSNVHIYTTTAGGVTLDIEDGSFAQIAGNIFEIRGHSNARAKIILGGTSMVWNDTNPGSRRYLQLCDITGTSTALIVTESALWMEDCTITAALPIQLYDCLGDNVHIRDCNFVTTSNYCAQVQRCNDLAFRDCYFTGHAGVAAVYLCYGDTRFEGGAIGRTSSGTASSPTRGLYVLSGARATLVGCANDIEGTPIFIQLSGTVIEIGERSYSGGWLLDRDYFAVHTEWHSPLIETIAAGEYQITVPDANAANAYGNFPSIWWQFPCKTGDTVTVSAQVKSAAFASLTGDVVLVVDPAGIHGTLATHAPTLSDGNYTTAAVNYTATSTGGTEEEIWVSARVYVKDYAAGANVLVKDFSVEGASIDGGDTDCWRAAIAGRVQPAWTVPSAGGGGAHVIGSGVIQ